MDNAKLVVVYATINGSSSAPKVQYFRTLDAREDFLNNKEPGRDVYTRHSYTMVEISGKTYMVGEEATFYEDRDIAETTN